ncbi:MULTISPECIES: hypothetical protein [Bacillaceae]|uniref:hypothetical protein n=1 Tax=Bacillaceae TaxID=186817 RepID=UPI001BDE35AF|nr:MULTISPECIES: hypothetical protein [Bacillaceae]MDX8360247.1 hypothetical protein [Cytobacillus sp. IB215316]
MKSIIFGLGVIILVSMIVLLIKKRVLTNDNEPLLSDFNCDPEDIQPFFMQLSSSIFDRGFTEDDINLINKEIHMMKKRHEDKKIGTFNVIFKEEKTRISVEAEVENEDGSKGVTLFMYANPEVVKAIDQEVEKFYVENDM